jgi:hypothetical protein
VVQIEKWTFGMGDRFAHQGVAQLEACIQARAAGIEVCPVWNKSNREHQIIGSLPDSVRFEADSAVAACHWGHPYYVDADHISQKTVEPFLASCNFFTLDVADYVGQPPEPVEVTRFIDAHKELLGQLQLPGLERSLEVTMDDLRHAAGKFLKAIHEAGEVYRTIENTLGKDSFITEVSVDETDEAQSPQELLCILAMLADQNIPAQTIAPKFTGRFNKGVDYVGDLSQFEKEFNEDLCVLRYGIKEFGLPASLKLSVHSGSDKFSLYPVINSLIKKHDFGLHVKTAGTTWLEEVIGLAEAGGEGLNVAKAIYSGAYEKFDELTAPYSTVIDIDPAKLPEPETVKKWTASQFVSALRHNRDCPDFNPHFRQLLHVGFKIAAQMGAVYTDALKAHHELIAKNVTTNFLDRHLRPLFQ